MHQLWNDASIAMATACRYAVHCC